MQRVDIARCAVNGPPTLAPSRPRVPGLRVRARARRTLRFPPSRLGKAGGTHVVVVLGVVDHIRGHGKVVRAERVVRLLVIELRTSEREREGKNEQQEGGRASHADGDERRRTSGKRRGGMRGGENRKV